MFHKTITSTKKQIKTKHKKVIKSEKAASINKCIFKIIKSENNTKNKTRTKNKNKIKVNSINKNIAIRLSQVLFIVVVAVRIVRKQFTEIFFGANGHSIQITFKPNINSATKGKRIV